MKQKQVRGLHRDLGYFYIGLIIAFAFSGILMNHREVWKPEKYTVETRQIQVQLPAEELISEKYIDKLKETKLAVRGSKTMKWIKEHGLEPVHVSEDGTMNNLLAALAEEYEGKSPQRIFRDQSL